MAAGQSVLWVVMIIHCTPVQSWHDRSGVCHRLLMYDGTPLIATISPKYIR